MGKVKCWEMFQCKKRVCPAYKSRNLNCWLFSGTHCRDEIQGKFIDKIEMCLDCEVFKMNLDVPSMKDTCEVFNEQIKEYRQIVEDRDRELENISIEMAIGLSEVFGSLKSISSGDPLVRIPEISNIELIHKLKHLVNLTAQNIEEIVELSHEFAIGLAEHFDVLHKVSKGDLNARVSWNSQVELLEALKNKTNQMIVSISNEIVERKHAEEMLEERTYDLWERVKELNCLYSIFELAEEKDISLEEMLQGTVERIPFGLRYPEITCARITLDNQEFRTKIFRETVWKLKSDIYISGYQSGTIEVYYLEEKPSEDEGPFIMEEKTLLNTIAKHSGRVIERLRAEETLRASEEKYRTVFENTGNATIIVEEDTTISLVNTKFEQLSGYPKGEIENKKSWAEFFHRDDLDRVKEYNDQRKIESKIVPANHEVRFIDREGIVRDVILSISNIPGTRKSVGSLLDVTERKRLEEQMYHAEKLASIGTLAAGVAHEINNPLAIILGFSDLLSEKVPPDSEFHEILMTIQKHGTNAKRIVENLLSFVRYKEHGEEDVDINKIIEEVITIKGHAMSNSNISVKKNMAESLPVIRGNAGELQQVIFNIVNNAISAMKGGGNLIVETRAVTTHGTQNIEIVISDTGIGIKPEHRSRIYDPLFTTKKVGEGTGLGLTVSYAIIKKYGGEITFETRTKETSTMSGTTFTIVLPTGKEMQRGSE
jgi:PAS domain S-box-containing protein